MLGLHMQYFFLTKIYCPQNSTNFEFSEKSISFYLLFILQPLLHLSYTKVVQPTSLFFFNKFNLLSHPFLKYTSTGFKCFFYCISYYFINSEKNDRFVYNLLKYNFILIHHLDYFNDCYNLYNLNSGVMTVIKN
jgi:hypothetical protein